MTEEDTTSGAVPLSLEKQKKLQQLLVKKRAARTSQIMRRPPGAPPMLSLAQQQLWFLEQFGMRHNPYHVPIYLRLHGQLDAEALHASVHEIVRRHEVLRTQIVDVGGLPQARVAHDFEVPFRVVDLRDLPGDRRDAVAQALLTQESARRFNLAGEVLLRILLLRVADDQHVFFHNSHHIAWDLGSKALFYRELEMFYSGSVAGGQAVLPELAIQYADYAEWQRQHLAGDELEKLQGFWRQQLNGAPMKLELPCDLPRPKVQSLRGAKRNFSLSSETLRQAREVSAQSGGTLFMTMCAAFAVFLYSCTGREELLIGTPVDGRDRAEVKELIGFFINTVVLRIRIEPHDSFSTLLRKVREVTLDAVAHSALPFQKVVEVVRPPRDLSRSPIFQINFRLQPGPPTLLHLAGVETEGPYVVDNGAAKFDLALELPSVPAARGYWEYSTDLFEESSILRMADRFERLLEALITNPERPIKNVTASSPEVHVEVQA